MKIVILLCVVAATLAQPPFDISGNRPGVCPDSEIITDELRRTSQRCSEYDFRCDRDGEHTYKCCEYDTVSICVEPVYVEQSITQMLPVTGQLSLEEEVSLAVHKTRELIQNLGRYSTPPVQQLDTIRQNTVRWCVSDPCQETKCKRMVSEFTYNSEMTPRKEWTCMLAKSQEHCMFWVEQGWADIMTTRQGEVFTAKTKFDLLPIAYETTINDENPEILTLKHYQNVTFALKSTRQVSPNTWAEIRGKTTCHAGIDLPASFNAPVCRMIHDNVIPVRGDHVESFADFIQESCIPGILNMTYNKNGTYPKNLVSLCEDEELEYSGIRGSLSCLESGKGQVTFVDQKIITKIMRSARRDEFMVVCQEESKNLDEDVINDVSCHIGHTPRPTIFISKNNTDAKTDEIKTLLSTALRLYGKTNPQIAFNLFDSSVYECEPCQKTGLSLKKDVLFLEESNTLKIIDPTKVYAERVFEAYSTCSSLTPKPRAKMCVTTTEKFQACLRFKDIAEKFPLVKDVAWGCVLANSSMECMQAVHNNTADLFQADPFETFIGGKEFLLDPLMSIHKNASISQDHTFTRTLAVIKASSLAKFEDLIHVAEDQPKYITDLWKLKTCHAGLGEVSAFHNPIGWLLSNGTIPRIGSVFESINRYFKSTCVPGIEPETWRWDTDLLLGHELNWGFPTLNMFNFTGPRWFTWNSPATWNYLTYNRKVSPGVNIAKLVALKKMNLTSPLIDTNHNAQIDTLMLDDLIGVEGLSSLVTGLKNTLGDDTGRIRERLFRDRMSNAFPNFEGLKDYTLQGKVDMINRMREAQQDRVSWRRDNRDSTEFDFVNRVRESFQTPFLTSMFSRLLELRSDKMATLEEIISHIKQIPSLTNFKDEEITTVLGHPAVMSYVQTYYPRLSKTFVELFDNVELREREFNRYTNPLWLSPKINDFLEIFKKHQLEITETCNSNLPLQFHSYEGSLRCLKSGVADIAFFDEQTLLDQDLLSRVGFTYNDLRLVCPNGQVVEINMDLNITKVCNFGEVMNPVILTSYNTTGSWRWNITKALMIAHQSPAVFTLYGEGSLLGVEFNKLLPIDLLNQTYQTYLGPMVLRSFEAIIKASSYDWFKDQNGVCYGETFTNVIKERKDTCQAIVKDVTCVGQPRMKKISVGRFGEKKYKVVKMCSRPSKFVRQMTEFTCDNGYGYLRPVVTAVACECMPCEETLEFNVTFPSDSMWTYESTKYVPLYRGPMNPYNHVSVWGNMNFWYNQSINENFELGQKSVVIERPRQVIRERPVPGVVSQVNEEVDPEESALLETPHVTKTCESVWSGQSWHKEWFPTNATGSCVFPVPGARAKSRLERFRQTLKLRRGEY